MYIRCQKKEKLINLDKVISIEIDDLNFQIQAWYDNYNDFDVIGNYISTDRANKALGEIVEGIKRAARTSTFIVEAPED